VEEARGGRVCRRSRDGCGRMGGIETARLTRLD
jgi:hypothetical protein